MTTTLARPVASYIAGANAQDVDSVTACFAEGAVVHNEGRSREGISLDGGKIARLEIS